MCSQFSLVAFVGILACHLETNRAHVGMFLKEADLNQIIIYQTLKFFFALFLYISLGHYLASDIQFQTKIQQTKMLVTCQRFGICFYLGWSGLPSFCFEERAKLLQWLSKSKPPPRSFDRSINLLIWSNFCFFIWLDIWK